MMGFIWGTFRWKRKVAAAVCVAMITTMPSGTVYANTGGENRSNADAVIRNTLTDVDFSTFSLGGGDTITIDNSFIGGAGVKTGEKELGLIEDAAGKNVLRSQAFTADINAYKSGLQQTGRFDMECRVRFGDTASEREIGTMKGIVEKIDGVENYSWPTPLRFKANGKIADSAGSEFGTYAADTWYTIKIDVDTDKKTYQAWIDDETSDEDYRIEASLNQGGSGDKIWRGCSATSVWKQKKSSNSIGAYMDLSYFKASEIKPDTRKKWGIITGTYTELDFSQINSLEGSATEKVIDKSFLGTAGISEGERTCEIVSGADGSNVLRFTTYKAATKDANTYKGGLKIKDRFGIECKVMFSDTTSQREVGTMKSLTEGGTYSWPAPVVFANNGDVKTAKGVKVGTYIANTWYTIKLEIDTDNQKYYALIQDGDLSTPDMVMEETLNAGGSNPPKWHGCQFTYVLTQKRNHQNAASYMDVAYVKAGKIQPVIEDIYVKDISMNVGEGVILNPAVGPEDAYAGELQYETSRPDVAKTYENGILALGEGTAEITVTEPASGKKAVFSVTVSEQELNWELQKVEESILSASLWSGNRTQIHFSTEQIKEIFQKEGYETPETYKGMSDDAFAEAVKKNARTMSTGKDLKTNKYEPLSRYLVLMYHSTGEWEYARKAAMILYYQAQYYPHLLKTQDVEVTFGENVVYAFGYLLGVEHLETGKSVWEDIALNGVTKEEVTGVIANLYLRPLAHASMDGILGRRLGNLDVYAARSASAVASIVNDPYLIRKVIMLYDSMFAGDHYYFDQMWEEGTLSYGGQVTNNAATGMEVLANFQDPEGYSDPENPEEYGLSDQVMGISLDSSSINSRWALFERAKEMPGYMVYPDGSPIAVNDTHYKANADMEPIQEELLNNIELPGYGYYGLVQGTVDDAVHAGLLYQTKQGFFGGSHDHINLLSMTLWGAGTELLPDVGYVTATSYPDSSGSKIRYPAMRPVFANMPWIFMNDGANEESNLGWFKPRLLAYDDGNDTGGIVTLAEGSDVGPDHLGISVDQRLLMNIELDESHSYVFDLTRMKGGDAHALFQRGSELEDMTRKEMGIRLESTGKSSMQDVDIFKNAGLQSQWTVKDMSYLYNPEKADSSQDFSIVWEGQTTGSRVTTYMNGVDQSEVYLSSIPTPRRITTKAEEKTMVAPHLTRYRNASGGKLTRFGAVHETARRGEADLVESVEWLYPDGIDEMGILGKITSAQYIDYIYTSGDTEVRSYDDISFSGKIAMVRKDRKSGMIVYSYVYGEGIAAETVGAGTQTFEVLDLTTAPILMDSMAEETENTITIDGTLDYAQSYPGKRVQLVFGDGSGYGVKIKEIKERGDTTVLTTEEYIPAMLTGNGAEWLFFPLGQKIKGKVSVIFEMGVTEGSVKSTGIHIQKLPDKTIYEIGEVFDPEGLVVVAATASNAQPVELSPDEYEIDDSQFESDEEGTYKIVVNHTPDTGEGAVTHSAFFQVHVVEHISDLYVTKIAVEALPKKMVYEVGDSLDTDGMVIKRYQKASASNAGILVDELSGEDYQLDYDFETPGRRAVTVSHGGMGSDGEEREFTAVFYVTVQEKIQWEDYITTRIKVTKSPKKTVYDAGEEIDLTGMEITSYLKASNSNATKARVLDEDEYEVDYDFGTSGRKKVKVIHEAAGSGGTERRFTTTFTVSVRSRFSESNISDDTTAVKTGPEPARNWSMDENGWKIMRNNGTQSVDEWIEAEYNRVRDWYRTDENGYIMTGWFLDSDGNRYYLNELHDGRFGAMVTGWRLVDGTWYYFNEMSDGTKGRMIKNQ